MKKTHWRMSIAVLALLLPLMGVAAQEEDPTQDAGITVTGTIANQNVEGLVPEGLRVMLHGWDPTGASREMIPGVSGPDGKFTFENVIIEPGVLYNVMVTYQEAIYFSEPSEIQENGELEPFKIEIYETVKDLSGVKIDLLNIVFGYAQGGLAVGEIYRLSNQGERTVAGAVDLGDGRDATMKFTLPEDAASVQFPGASGDRFVIFSDGFADQLPLVPGEGSGQIFVSYIMTYEDGISLTRSVPFDTSDVNFYIPRESGLSLVSKGAEYVGVQTNADGQTYEQYTSGSLMAGEELTFTLTGSFEPAEFQSTSASSEIASINNELLIGLGLLGIGLITIGILWWRRDSLKEDFEDAESLPDS